MNKATGGKNGCQLYRQRLRYPLGESRDTVQRSFNKAQTDRLTGLPALGDGGHFPEGDVHADGVGVVQDVDPFVVEGHHHLGQRHAWTHHLQDR